MAGQQRFVLHILLMEDRMSKVLQIARAVFFAHLERVENVDLGAGYVDPVRKRHAQKPRRCQQRQPPRLIRAAQIGLAQKQAAVPGACGDYAQTQIACPLLSSRE